MRTFPTVAALALLSTVLAGCSGGQDGEAAIPTGPGQAMLRGVVVTAAIVPIPNATVAVEPGGFETTTDGDGEFEVGPLDAGAYSLAVRAQGYAPQRSAVQVE